MFTKELADKIDNFIMEKFPIIYNYNFDGIVLVYGGVIRNMIMNLPVKDLDFVILTQGKCQIWDFIKQNKLKYRMNAFSGPKILYNEFSVDIFSVNDLLDAAVYDMDWLFYDIHAKIFISCGARNAISNRKITQINFEKIPVYANKFRKKKIIDFIKYVTNSDKKVRIKENKLLWEYKMFIKRIKMKLKNKRK